MPLLKHCICGNHSSMSSRELTYDINSLNAFVGILGYTCQLYRPNLVHVSGLAFYTNDPASFLDALLWELGGFLSQHSRYGTLTSHEHSCWRTSFPSWSWTGWTGIVPRSQLEIAGFRSWSAIFSLVALSGHVLEIRAKPFRKTQTTTDRFLDLSLNI